jgi:exodeoxyribonuclease VII small subunit
MTGKKMKNEKDLSFEEALEFLEAIAEKLESGDLGLDDSLTEFERGINLARQCHAKIEEAERKIEILQKGENNTVNKKSISVDPTTGEIDEEQDLQGSLL